MTGTTGSAALALAPPAGETFGHVLAGTALAGDAARLAAALDPGFLAEAGWDPVSRVLSLPAAHPLLGRLLCRVGGCPAKPLASLPGVCYSCFSRLTAAGLSAGEIAGADLPRLPEPATACAVPGCQCVPTVFQAALCEPHARQHRQRARRPPVSQFIADPRVRPLPPHLPCSVTACIRAADGARGYCNTHYQRWRVAALAVTGLDEEQWKVLEPAVADPGLVSLRGLPPLVVTEVLAGVRLRIRGGAKITDVDLRGACDELRRRQLASVRECSPGNVQSKTARSLLNALARHVRRALADPGSEHARDVWDLAVFGHRGSLSFLPAAQPWLRQAAKHWAGEELPRHRGGGAAKVRGKVNALGRLSESLRVRDDHGLVPAALGRADIENFLNRLAYLESEGKISRYQRIVICRDVRQALTGIRAQGLTRPGQPAAGLPGDFSLGRADIPAEPGRGEPGRDLPPEIMAVLCENLGALHMPEARTAVEILIDTGRRPEDIISLPLDCLDRDPGGAPVLVYDNVKADRLGRRLPVGEPTAGVVRAQQARVRARFPDTPASELKLLPSPRANPRGDRPVSLDTLEGRHREWADSLGTLRTRDGAEFDKARVILYAYRHSYAQRHADAGVAIDVLAELLDHRNLNVTRRYYRVGDERRRDAVDKVTAMSFDRHGNRIWRDARALLESEHARYAVGEVAVPYGTCAEPSNVQAGGGACPVRFRCAGCDHFRTNVSYLPDLTAYLDDLLRTRERLAAAIDGVDEWARADAMPAGEEITRIRRLISRIKGDIARLPEAGRAGIDEAVSVIRRHRAVSLGMPAVRPAADAHGQRAVT